VSVAILAIACIAYGVFAMNSLVFAEEGDSVSEAQSTEKANDQANDQAVVKKPVKKAKGGKGTREKDTDGTEAPDRFKADTVIKSQYKLNGQPLEVDPD
jgi:hypothetical protein